MKSLMIALVASSVIMFTACKKTESTYSDLNTGPQKSLNTNDAKVKAAKAKLDEIFKAYPQLAEKSKMTHDAKRSKKSGLPWNADYTEYNDILNKAIDPSDYDCESTGLRDYLSSTITDWDADDRALFNGWNFLIWDYAYLFENFDSESTPYYGSTGQYTQVTNKTFKSLQGFWDISTDIYLADAHGDFYSDNDKLNALFDAYISLGMLPSNFPVDDLIDALQTVFGSSRFWEYKHPYLSFNAYAAPADADLGTDKKIIMGDGIIEAYDELGYDDVASQAVLAHEYGHHVQFANNVTFTYSPEGTRRTELMADALAAYYLTHKRGATMNWKRVKQFLEVYYNIGDCAFTNPNHHGTPNQRLKAATWGYEVASDTKKKGKVMTSADFIEMFDEVLSDLVASDSE
jgi:hypothetical protein